MMNAELSDYLKDEEWDSIIHDSKLLVPMF